VDVLVVDDMDNVQKKLRTLLPERLSMNSCTSGQAGMTLCRERVYRVVLVDKDLPEVAGGAMVKHMKVLQPHTAFVAMALRSNNDITAEAKGQGFDGVLYKPFTQDSIEDLLVDYFDTQDLTQREDNIIRISEYRGRKERIEKYYKRILPVLREDLQYMAEACFEEAIVDASKLAFEAQKSPQLIRDVAAEAERLGLQLRLVGSEELQRCLKNFTETSSVAFFAALSEAKQAAA
jgi:CheY-like chemotaxis protein